MTDKLRNEIDLFVKDFNFIATCNKDRYSQLFLMQQGKAEENTKANDVDSISLNTLFLKFLQLYEDMLRDLEKLPELPYAKTIALSKFNMGEGNKYPYTTLEMQLIDKDPHKVPQVGPFPNNKVYLKLMHTNNPILIEKTAWLVYPDYPIMDSSISVNCGRNLEGMYIKLNDFPDRIFNAYINFARKHSEFFNLYMLLMSNESITLSPTYHKWTINGNPFLGIKDISISSSYFYNASSYYEYTFEAQLLNVWGKITYNSESFFSINGSKIESKYMPKLSTMLRENLYIGRFNFVIPDDPFEITRKSGKLIELNPLKEK